MFRTENVLAGFNMTISKTAQLHENPPSPVLATGVSSGLTSADSWHAANTPSHQEIKGIGSIWGLLHVIFSTFPHCLANCPAKEIGESLLQHGRVAVVISSAKGMAFNTLQCESRTLESTAVHHHMS